MTYQRRSRLAVMVFLAWTAIDYKFAIGEPLFEKANVFRARDNGYDHVRIPGIVVTNAGTVLAFGEARHDDQGGGDWADIDLVLRRSTDGGKSWEPIQILEDGIRYQDVPRNVSARRKPSEEKFVTCNNPVMIVDRTSDVIHFLYCIEYQKCFYRRSTDDGLTFSEPVEITTAFDGFATEYNWKVLATGPGHGIQLTNGRLVVPIWLSTGDGDGGHRPSRSSTIYSDDHGITWKHGEILVNHPELINPSEAVAVQISDGRTMLNIRSESKQHRRAISYSADGATGWTKPHFDDELYEPVCMASLLRLSGDHDSRKSRLLFCSPSGSAPRDGAKANGPMKKRERLTLRISYNDGNTWPVSKVIEPSGSGYSDLAVGRDGSIYCFYERSGEGNAFDSGALTCAKINLEWLTDGSDTWAKENN